MVIIRQVCDLLAEKLLLESLTYFLQMHPGLTSGGTALALYHIATASGNKVSSFNKTSISDRQGALSVCQIYMNDEKEKNKWNCCEFLTAWLYS